MTFTGAFDPLALRAAEWQLLAINRKEILAKKLTKLRKQMPETAKHRIVAPNGIPRLQTVDHKDDHDN